MSRAPKTQFKLSEPIQAHGEEVDTLWLRQPTAGDIAKCGGEPFRPGSLGTGPDDGMPEVDVNMPRMLKLISTIADIPMSSVEAISWGDLYELQMQVVGFFGQSVSRRMGVKSDSSTSENGSVPASTSPGSGDVIQAPSLRSIGRS